MSKYHNVEKSRRQKKRRKARDEYAFIFTSDLRRCLARVKREDWEEAISFSGGNPAHAAETLGICGIPRNAKALWGKSEEEAKGTYRNWQKKKAKKGKST